jgi:hypothetical protein
MLVIAVRPTVCLPTHEKLSRHTVQPALSK